MQFPWAHLHQAQPWPPATFGFSKRVMSFSSEIVPSPSCKRPGSCTGNAQSEESGHILWLFPWGWSPRPGHGRGLQVFANNQPSFLGFVEIFWMTHTCCPYKTKKTWKKQLKSAIAAIVQKLTARSKVESKELSLSTTTLSASACAASKVSCITGSPKKNFAIKLSADEMVKKLSVEFSGTTGSQIKLPWTLIWPVVLSCRLQTFWL